MLSSPRLREMLPQSPIHVLGLALLALIAATSIVHVFRLWHQRHMFKLARGCQPPRMVMNKFYDLYLSIKAIAIGRYLEVNMQRYLDYGTTYQSSFLGMGKLFFTSDPENIRAILAIDFVKWGLGKRRSLMLRDLIRDAIFVVDGAKWEHSRSLLRPSFKKVNTEDTTFFETHFQELLTALPPVDPFSGLINVNLQPYFLRMTLDSATELLLGQSFHSQLAPPGSQAANFLDAFDHAVGGVFRNDAFNFGLLAPWGLYKWIMRLGAKDDYQLACDYIKEVVEQKLDERLSDFEAKKRRRCAVGEGPGMEMEMEQDKYVFLEEIAEQTDDRNRIRDEIVSVLFAGRDSTGSLLSNTMFMLARRPDVWDRLRGEVQETFQGRIPEGGAGTEMLRHMKFMKCVLNETLRMYPPIPVNFRTAFVDTTLPRGGGKDGQSPIFIPAGTSVQYHAYATHRSTAIYGETANTWEPSRWEDSNLKPGWGYVPFNGGPRICPGQTFSLAETTYIMTRLLQEFKAVERRDPKVDFEARVSLSTVCRLGCKVALTKA